MESPVERFRDLLRIPTVSYADESLIDGAAFETFHEALARLYPAAHAALQREVVAGYSLLYRWAGASADEPLVLMAHQDVVPVVETDWDHPPFAAEIVGEGTDAAIYARGAIDDKGALVAIMEAVEALATDGFTPARDIWLAFGHNEETAGDGARAIVENLRGRGVAPALVLDEGGAVVEGIIPGVEVPTAMVGVAERGVMTVMLTVHEAGGHASTPPAMPATARLARAIDRLRRRPFPLRLVAPVRAMLATIAPHAPEPLRTLFRRADLSAPLLTAVFAASGPEMNAQVRTTAVATELAGATGENVLAATARAAVNVRLITGETVESAVAHLRRAIDDDRVELAVRHASNPSSVSPWRGEPWRRIATAVHDTLGSHVVTTPYLQTGASDSRWFTEISTHVYRFTPFHLTRAERDCLHTHNERIRVEVWLRGIEFYRALISAS